MQNPNETVRMHAQFNVTQSCVEALQDHGNSPQMGPILKTLVEDACINARDREQLLRAVNTGNGNQHEFIVHMRPSDANGLTRDMYIVVKNDSDKNGDYVCVVAWHEGYYNKHKQNTGPKGGLLRQNNGYANGYTHRARRPHELSEYNKNAHFDGTPLNTMTLPSSSEIAAKNEVKRLEKELEELKAAHSATVKELEAAKEDAVEEFQTSQKISAALHQALQGDSDFLVLATKDGFIVDVNTASNHIGVAALVETLITEGHSKENIKFVQIMRPKVKVSVEF